MINGGHFDEYWRQLRNESAALESDWERIARDQIVTAHGLTWRIDWIRFSGFADMVVEAWLASPSDHDPTGVGILWLPGYSYGTPPPDTTNLVSGCVTMGINVHGNAPDAPYVNPAGKNDYILRGIDDPYTYVYRGIVCNCLASAAVLAAQAEVDPAELVVAGMSQGGGLALIAGAQSEQFRICFADMPFLSNVPLALELSNSPSYRVLRDYVHKHPEALDTVSLFDPLLHAPRVKIPTWLTAGGRDPTCRPPTVQSVYEAVGASEKEYVLFPNSGHVFVPEMNTAYHEWIARYLHF